MMLGVWVEEEDDFRIFSGESGGCLLLICGSIEVGEVRYIDVYMWERVEDGGGGGGGGKGRLEGEGGNGGSLDGGG